MSCCRPTPTCISTTCRAICRMSQPGARTWYRCRTSMPSIRCPRNSAQVRRSTCSVRKRIYGASTCRRMRASPTPPTRARRRWPRCSGRRRRRTTGTAFSIASSRSRRATGCSVSAIRTALLPCASMRISNPLPATLRSHCRTRPVLARSTTRSMAASRHHNRRAISRRSARRRAAASARARLRRRRRSRTRARAR